MNEDRDQDRRAKLPAPKTRPPAWEQDLRPRRQTGAQIGQPTDAQIEAEWEAFHQRKQGQDSGAVNDEQAVGATAAATPPVTPDR
jgi:hypothetical protein